MNKNEFHSYIIGRDNEYEWDFFIAKNRRENKYANILNIYLTFLRKMVIYMQDR